MDVKGKSQRRMTFTKQYLYPSMDDSRLMMMMIYTACLYLLKASFVGGVFSLKKQDLPLFDFILSFIIIL